MTTPEEERPEAAQWKRWLGHEPRAPLPPLRMILIWDNLAGHLSCAIVDWLFRHGVMPLYTPLSGSWLNLAEAVQRIIVRRELAGQHPPVTRGDHPVVRTPSPLGTTTQHRSRGAGSARSDGSGHDNAAWAAREPFWLITIQMRHDSLV